MRARRTASAVAMAVLVSVPGPAAAVGLPPTPVPRAEYPAATTYPVGFTDPQSVAIADFTGDGRADVALSTGFHFDPAHDYKVFLFPQLANGRLADPVAFDTHSVSGSDSNSLTVADLDGDGDLDLLLAHLRGLDVFEWSGGTFLPARF